MMIMGDLIDRLAEAFVAEVIIQYSLKFFTVQISNLLHFESSHRGETLQV